MKGNELDFSFSGLKTAVLRWTQQHDITAETALRKSLQNPTIEELRAATPQTTLDLIASFQQTVIDELLRHTSQAADQIGAESVIVAGGVACNAGLRAQAKRGGLRYFFPTPQLSTDNAAMIAAAAYPKFLHRKLRRLRSQSPGGVSVSVKVMGPQLGEQPKLPIPGVKNIIAVGSGKGGIGESTVSVNLAITLSRLGYAVGLMDADVYGPNVPLMMGIQQTPHAIGQRIQPLESHGVQV